MRVVANGGDKANTRATPRRDNGLIGALAAQIFRGSESHDRFAGPWKPVHSNHAIDRGVTNHMDHFTPFRPRQRARCSAENTRLGFSIKMRSMVRWSMPWRFRRGTKCLRI